MFSALLVLNRSRSTYAKPSEESHRSGTVVQVSNRRGSLLKKASTSGHPHAAVSDLNPHGRQSLTAIVSIGTTSDVLPGTSFSVINKNLS